MRISRGGMEQVVELELNPEEQKLLDGSVTAVRKNTGEVEVKPGVM